MSVEISSIDLENFEKFESHAWLAPIVQRYEKHDAVLAKHAATRLANDLDELNERFSKANGRVAFTSIDGRVKTKDSMLRKLHRMCCEPPHSGITPESLAEFYANMKDLCGVRFSCPYFDEVKPAVNELVRPRLSALGYATDLQSDPRYEDKDYLDEGDEFGYRSYHFFVKVPAFRDIYGNVDMCLCEVQARTELQHIWAVKSHNLLYKPDAGWDLADRHVVQDMRQVSNSLRAADQFLISIRDRVIKGA